MAKSLNPSAASHCPFIGLRDDSSTFFSYLSTGNHCLHCRHSAVPLLAHQEAYCLGGKHADCPVYRQTENKPFPPQFRAGEGHRAARSGSTGRLLVIFIGILSIGLVGFMFLRKFLAPPLMIPLQTFPTQTIPTTLQPSATIVPPTRSPVPTSTSTNNPTTTPEIYASTMGSGIYTSSRYPTGNGVLSLRFDDGVPRDYSFIYPQLTARSLVAGFAVILDRINPNYLTLEQIKTMQTAGMEIMCHSYSHNRGPSNLSEFTIETAIAVKEMRMMGLNIDSWVQPGVWKGDYYTIMYSSTTFFGTPEDALMRNYFNAWEGYMQSQDRDLPVTGNYRYGAFHYQGDAKSLVDLKALVDWSITNHKGLEILFHSNYIGAVGKISEADFTSFLDYVQTKVTAGTLTVLTPTQQLFAVPFTK